MQGAIPVCYIYTDTKTAHTSAGGGLYPFATFEHTGANGVATVASALLVAIRVKRGGLL